MRKTKIVVTLGPAVDAPEVLEGLVASGMDAARLNFSHGTHEEHKKRIDAVRKAAGDRDVAIILDTKGPEIRTGLFEKPVTLKAGGRFVLSVHDRPGNEKGCSVSYEKLNEVISVGNRIMIDDGLIELKVVAVGEDSVDCTVINGGTVSSNKGINLPGIRTGLPALTDKDRADLRFGAENGVDYIAASFVRRKSDVEEIRRVLDENGGGDIGIIAKIENEEGITNIDEIIAAADGIMVARGDLGVEIEPERLPLLQKMMIKKCNRAGKPVITATQMLDSMIHNPRPTRAEVADVANAIIDGSDCVMLSGETAAGAYPLESVRMMARIAETTEKDLDYGLILSKNKDFQSVDVTNSIGYSTCEAAHLLGAKAIITATESGFSARVVSKFRPETGIIAAVTDAQTARRLAVTWGVFPVIIEKWAEDEAVFKASLKAAREHFGGRIDFLEGDRIVFTAGLPYGVSGTTNMMRIYEV